MRFLSLMLLFFIIPSSVFATTFTLPRFSSLQKTILPYRRVSSLAVEDFKTFFYTQTLDHFSYRPESYATFKQRYLINHNYWGGAHAKAPIFVYLGAEGPLEDDLQSVGFLINNAPRFKALLIYIEHRFYGKSIPLGSLEKAMKNDGMRGCFNSAQALADYAEVLLDLKKQLSAQNSPIIVIGASYGGMLASWFRLKFPHIAFGALASSAPILYYGDITSHNGYYSIVTKDFKEASESCYATIRKSWSEIDIVASKPNGRSILGKRFKTCKPLNKTSELKNYLEAIYSEAAQYNEPPTYPVTEVCRAMDGESSGTGVLSRIFAGVVAYKGKKSCYDINEYNEPNQSIDAWGWQRCTEMVAHIGHGGNNSMFPPSPFNLRRFISDCKKKYGIQPRIHWIPTYYGGRDMKLILRQFASNIIFSNGLKDPYSGGGVLEDISDSIVAIHTIDGSHCLDMEFATERDPEWLVMQRKLEAEIIEEWITKYYADIN